MIRRQSGRGAIQINLCAHSLDFRILFFHSRRQRRNGGLKFTLLSRDGRFQLLHFSVFFQDLAPAFAQLRRGRQRSGYSRLRICSDRRRATQLHLCAHFLNLRRLFLYSDDECLISFCCCAIVDFNFAIVFSCTSQVTNQGVGPKTPSRKPGSGLPPSAPIAGISTSTSSASPSPFASVVELEFPGCPLGTKSCG